MPMTTANRIPMRSLVKERMMNPVPITISTRISTMNTAMKIMVNTAPTTGITRGLDTATMNTARTANTGGMKGTAVTKKPLLRH